MIRNKLGRSVKNSVKCIGSTHTHTHTHIHTHDKNRCTESDTLTIVL